MSGIVFWIIVLAWIIIVVSKNAAKSTGDRNNQENTSQQVRQRMAQQASKRESQQELKERLAGKYGKETGKPKEDILQRAKASVAENFGNNSTGQGTDTVQNRQREVERRVAEKLAAVKETGPKESETDTVLREVEDLIVKGPDAGITFDRDFLSEGMDMLNRIQG